MVIDPNLGQFFPNQNFHPNLEQYSNFGEKIHSLTHIHTHIQTLSSTQNLDDLNPSDPVDTLNTLDTTDKWATFGTLGILDILDTLETLKLDTLDIFDNKSFLVKKKL